MTQETFTLSLLVTVGVNFAMKKTKLSGTLREREGVIFFLG